MNTAIYLLLGFLVVCALGVTLCKKLLTAVIILMCYSLVMSVLWLILESPDLAITEAAVGAGVTSLLFFAALKKLNAIDKEDSAEDES